MILWLWMATAGAVEVEAVLADGLDRAMATWATLDQVPHYVALAVTDVEGRRLGAREGAVAYDDDDRSRWLDVDLRLGTPELDSTHDVRGFSGLDDDTRERRRVAFEGPGEATALTHALWRELDDRWRDARERIVLLQADRAVRVTEEDPAPDFEPRAPVVDRRPIPPDPEWSGAWSDALLDVSRVLADSDVVVSSEARLDARRQVTTFVDTEGTRLVHGAWHVRLSLVASVVADDGDKLDVFRAIDLHALPAEPPLADLMALARTIVADAEALRAAPRATPYTGPVMLSGRAAGVFFHEVMGHRVEGHRNKDEEEGKTFLSYVGRPVLPAFLDVVDDPTVARLAGQDLNGHYAYDDEGVAAQRVQLVDDGIFTGFLMSRSPLADFPTSNGHGRRSPGRAPVARMGNTILTTTQGLDDATLRRRLRAEAKAQGLDYAYIVDEIDGGFTLTGREMPNAFNVRASKTWRVWVDGRPDELVRGLDLVGTPLGAFQNIVAAGNTPEVFNGVCGAESGWVPVSAVAPALLFKRLEFQLKEKGSERPPLLSRPDPDGVSEVTP